MKALAHVNVIVVGEGASISRFVAVCEQVFRDAGLIVSPHALGTEVEGEWDVVMSAIKTCHEEVHAAGAARIISSVSITTRTDREQSLEEKIAAVRAHFPGN